MKFYEVLKEFEDGKKIKRPNMEGYLIFDRRYEVQSKIRYVYNGSSPHYISEEELLANDWRIIEDIPEIQLFRSKEIRYTCPKCKRESEILVYTEDRSETVHECRHCGQKFRFSNLEEMKKMYYDTESKIEDYTPILIDFVKNPPDIITLNNNGSIVTYSRSNSTKGTK